MASMLPMMSLKRSIGRLEDKVAFPIKGVLDRPRLARLGNDVDARAQKLAEASSDQIEATQRRKSSANVLEAHGNIDIGMIISFVACGRTEEREAYNA